MQFSVVTNLKPDLREKTRQFLFRQMNQIAQNGKQTLDLVTEGWDHKPDFKAEATLQGDVMTASVTTDSAIFHWVDQGTQPHRIPRSGTARMSFPATYSPRTTVGRLRSNPLQFRSQRIVRGPTSFNHPGIEARNFTGQAGVEMQKAVVRQMAPLIRKLPI